MGTQKDRLNETVLLSTKIYVQTDGLENISNFTLKILLKNTKFSSSTLNLYLNISIGAKCSFSMEILTLKSHNITNKDIQIM